jgi:hypothetical protein
MPAINHIRAARYRALALVEKDQARAALLGRLADEADHGVLCTVRHLHLVFNIEASPIPRGRQHTGAGEPFLTTETGVCRSRPRSRRFASTQFAGEFFKLKTGTDIDRAALIAL